MSSTLATRPRPPAGSRSTSRAPGRSSSLLLLVDQALAAAWCAGQLRDRDLLLYPGARGRAPRALFIVSLCGRAGLRQVARALASARPAAVIFRATVPGLVLLAARAGGELGAVEAGDSRWTLSGPALERVSARLAAWSGCTSKVCQTVKTRFDEQVGPGPTRQDSI